MKTKVIFFILIITALIALACCGEDGLLTYEEFWDLSGKEQQEYYDTFDNVDDFFAWYNAAKAKFEAEHPGVDAGDGEIDLGDLVG